MSEQPNPVSRWFRRIARGAAPAAAVAPTRLGTPIAECRVRDMVEVVGHVSELHVRNEDGRRSLEATLSDETGSVRLLWMGRVAIPGIDEGRALRIVGRLSEVDGRRTIFNPRYELRAG